ncbi:MAG TPA: alcohol dehydrogenase catalytic domain-containing protein [Acidobacteriaceae bacterium]
MQAAVYYGKENVQAAEWPEPVCGERDVLVRVSGTGICGSDMQIYAGKHPRAQAPFVPGHEIFGRVDVIGAKVDSRWKRSTRVAVYPLISCGKCEPCLRGNAHVCAKLGLVGVDRDGGFAELVKVAPDQLVEVPDSIPDDEAPIIEPLAVAVHAVHESALRLGDSVLVTGGGPIGNLLAQTLRAAGAGQVVVSEVSSFRRKLIEDLGFPVIVPGEETAPQALNRILGKPYVDLVFEATGQTAAYRDAVTCCAVRGHISFVGIPKSTPEVDIQGVIFKELSTASARVYRMRDYDGAISLLARRAVDVRSLITDRIPLKDAPRAYEEMKHADKSAKIVLVPNA